MQGPCNFLAKATYQLTNVDWIEWDRLHTPLGETELQACKKPHDPTYGIQDGSVGEAEREIHCIMSLAVSWKRAIAGGH